MAIPALERPYGYTNLHNSPFWLLQPPECLFGNLMVSGQQNVYLESGGLTTVSRIRSYLSPFLTFLWVLPLLKFGL